MNRLITFGHSNGHKKSIFHMKNAISSILPAHRIGIIAL